MSTLAEPRTDIFKNGSDLGTVFTKITSDIPVVLVSSLNRLPPEAAVLMLSEMVLPFQGATEQAIETLAPKFFNAYDFKATV